MTNTGTLYLIPGPLGEERKDLILPENVKNIANSLTHFAVERDKTARHILKAIGYPHPFDSVRFFELNEHSGFEVLLECIEVLKNGTSVGMMSEAGAPCIADPGEQLVELAHQHGIRVVPLVGPSSILLALMASGLPANKFSFHGYLPVQPPERKKKIIELEKDSRKNGEAQIFIETPYRNMQLFEDITKACLESTLLCIASDITQQAETIKTMSIGRWRKTKVNLHKRPTVFILCAR